MAQKPNQGVAPPPGKQSKGNDGSLQAIIDAALKGGSRTPPPTTKTQNQDQIAIGMFKKYGPNWIKTGYYQTVLSYAHLYGVPTPYLAALFLTENPHANPGVTNSVGATGLAQIKDTTLANYNKGKTLTWGQGNTLGTGAVITAKMKQNPVFAIAYAAWRLAGHLDTYGSLDAAYNQGYNPGYKGNISKLVGSYVPTKSDYKPSALNQKLSGQPTGQASDPFVTYNKKTGKIGTTLDSTQALEFEGFPITMSNLKQQLQDKNALGGDIYSLTGKTPTLNLIAGFMATGQTTQQIENSLIDSKYFMNSPTGKKYSLSYLGVYQGIMGANAKVPTGASTPDASGKSVASPSWAAMVKNAAKNNLSTDEFATQLRNSPLYLKSNEFAQNKTSFSDSYEHIYGPMDDNAKKLASDAALAGWNSDQWEHYLRSQPSYTKTQEYKSHALDILDKLGMSFGFLPSAQGQTVTPSPGVTGTPDKAPGPDPRIPGQVGSPVPSDPTQGNGGVKF